MSNEPGSNRPLWDSETDNPELAEKVKVGLAEVIDPEIGLNVIQLGLIRNVRIEPENADISMILTTPFCPYGPAMIEAIRQKAESSIKPPDQYRSGDGDVGLFHDGRRPGCRLGIILTYSWCIWCINKQRSKNQVFGPRLLLKRHRG